MITEVQFFITGIVLSIISLFIAYHMHNDNKKLTLSGIGYILLFSCLSWLTFMIVFGYIVNLLLDKNNK